MNGIILPTKTVFEIQAENDKLRAERDEARDYAFEATKAITSLTVGGSEFFGRKLGDRYTADLPHCVQHIKEWRMRDNGRMMKTLGDKKTAEAEVARLTQALAAEESRSGRMAEALRPFARLAEHYHPNADDDLPADAVVPNIRDLRRARATLAALKEKTDDEA